MMEWHKFDNMISFDRSSFQYPLGIYRAGEFLLGMTGKSFAMDHVQVIYFNLNDDNKMHLVVRYTDGYVADFDIKDEEKNKLYRIMIKETGI